MKFAINYSTQAAELVSEGRIEVDHFKCPNWPDLVREAGAYRPVAVHFGLQAGSGQLKNSDWESISRLVTQTSTPYVNLHLSPSQEDYPGLPIETSKPDQFRQVVRNLIDDVRAVVAQFGPERVIAENVPYRGEGGKVLRPVAEPAVIRQVLETTGCGLLLDISHARITAHHLGIDARTYMSQLPVERLKELHFTGLHRLNGRLQDHLSILDVDWPFLEWVTERIRQGEWARPWVLALEYGGVGEKFAWRSDKAVIAEQVPRVYDMVMDV
jgi:uncharacterized protein (UPF0276 family)